MRPSFDLRSLALAHATELDAEPVADVLPRAADAPARSRMRRRRAIQPGVDETWQLLQFSDVIDFELASALAHFDVPVILWEPDRSLLPVRLGFREAVRRSPGSCLQVRRFPVMRGFARPTLAAVARTGPTLARRLGRHSPRPERATLVCSTPFFASVAERWPGPVVYWLSDLIVRYDGVDSAQVRELDRAMCRAATLVCPASERLAMYLVEEAGCAPEKIQILPNATRADNIPPEPLEVPQVIPGQNWPGPVAGVIGNLAENMDWVFLQKLLDLTPWLSWVFIGPAVQSIAHPEQREARAAVQAHPRAQFLGAKPYRDLYRYARSFTVAVMPYRQREPTFSGSSTRFYEHLAACHPILATPCVAQLLSKEPLLKLVRTSAEAASALEHLRAVGFDDGQREARWKASLESTWDDRAVTMRSALAERMG